MIPRFRRSCLVSGSLALIVALPACSAGRPAASSRPVTMPRPDLCKVLDRKIVATALLGKVKGCEQSDGADYHAARFTGDAVVRRHATPATLTVGYSARYEPKSGLDRWATFEQPQPGRVRMIGVGDVAVFAAGAAPSPQLASLRKNLILTVALETGKVTVPQDKLPDHLLEVARAAFDALPH
jgi:hypothetical protein